MKRKFNAGAAIGLLAVVLGALAIACGGGDEKAAAPAPTEAPAAKVPLFVDVDTVRGPEAVPQEERARKSCVQASRIPRGGQVVWRVRVYDPKTGQQMDDKALTSVVVTLGDGQTFPMKYGPHPSNPPGEYFWASSWKIPATYPTGTMDYKVTATDSEGRTGEFIPIKSVIAAVLTIVEFDPLAVNESGGDLYLATR